MMVESSVAETLAELVVVPAPSVGPSTWLVVGKGPKVDVRC